MEPRQRVIDFMMPTECILYSCNVVFKENKMGIGKEEISEMEQSIEIEECSSSSEEEESNNHRYIDTAEEPEVRVRRSTRGKHRPDFYGSGSIQLRMLIESLLQ